jgi:hypothetical protein
MHVKAAQARHRVRICQQEVLRQQRQRDIQCRISNGLCRQAASWQVA